MAGTTNFPAGLDSHSGADPFGFGEVVNGLATALDGSHASNATTLTVLSTTSFPSRGYLAVGWRGAWEVVSYTGKTATTFTGCTRGAGGTTALSHANGVAVTSAPVAAHHDDLAAAIAAIESLLIGNPGLNPIVNGGFNIWQDGTSFSSIADGTWGPDNWVYGKVGAVVHDLLRSTDVPAVAANAALANYSLQLDVTTVDSSIAAGDYCTIATRIEGFNWLPYARRAFSLSFWVKAAKTGTHCVYFKNSGNNRTYVAEYTVSVADTWEYKTITVSASPSAGTWDYTNGRGLEIGWTLSCGSTFQTTAGAWQTGDFKGTSSQVNETDNTANNFRIAMPMLVRGEVAAPFVGLPHALENLRACRYYEAFGGDAIAEVMGGMGQAISTVNAVIPFSYVEKRAVPTVTVSAATDFVLHDKDNNTIELTAHSALVPSTTTYLALATVASGLVAGNASYISADATGSARIKVAARIP